ncbi:PA domain-containing protein [Streptoalloteichus tenebrarius]|uniref:PA domain-containing protein n=1 Tax=Streptoalloteichus tenebrarius (strain ATCC 17920 / DSM 40477 / JCM 4838 / CBS 697.72 / NBRC 16177 / NCIMB 11028 / NRRL B-12390 / A12253. 1 / ISP 5477) TaxID=1933 RepID=A0ABT1HWT2_STRSD|nr:S8 family serine peptidase [Streptoalloteichus tenebrarius]MCP2259956.1 PA domain-containing protein [Streptoalloteichus tenebrarius]BFF03281.1 S8 family serine peptidase [Streptoalloteichus tenebrarius]
MSRTRGPGHGVRRAAARSAAALFAAVLATGVTGVGVASGQDGRGDLAPSVPAAGGLPAKALQDKIAPRLAAAQGRVTAFVELEKKPAVDAFTEKQGSDKEQAKQAAREAKQDTQRAAEKVVTELKAKDAGATETYRTSNAVPGVVVTADADKVRTLADLPEVRAVHAVVPKEPGNANAVQLTRTLAAWQQTGRLGDGIRVGVIDTGIDYTHATFGGPGTKAAYDAIDRTKADPSYFPTPKVVGGVDLAGDDYDGSGKSGPAAMVPKPDPNPMDCHSHGTHVAGTAAGLGVNADGSTFRGDYDKLDDKQLNEMRIGPGTAPKALLYAIKVFGCTGSTNLTGQALDWALDPDGDGDFSDRLDVVNLSLGQDYGAPDDPDSLFVRKLVKHGVLPVISAGNGGDLYDVGGSPGSTPEALTVASTRDSFVLRDGAEVVGPADVAGVKAGQYSQNYADYAGLERTKPVVGLTDESNKDGCRPFSSADKAAVVGRFVWLEWDDNDASRRCGSGVRADNAQAAGAVGAIFSSSVDNFNAGIGGNKGIPVFQFTGTATKALRPALAAGTLQVRMAGDLRTSVKTHAPEISDTPSTFTSRGVHHKVVKPDVAAPGDTIASALVGSGNGTLVISGTSMAAPHTSGIAALVRQAHPDWTPEEVKAAVMNTAGADVRTGPNGTVLAPNRVGAGRIDAKSALDNQVLAMVEDDPGAVSVSFGTVEVSGRTEISKTVKVVNKGVNSVELTPSFQAATQIPGVRYEVSTSSIRLSPRGVAKVKLTLKIDDPGALRRTVDPTVQTTQLNVARQFLADASGRLVLTPKNGSSTPLRVPVYAAPKPVAKISAGDRVKFHRGDAQAVLNLKGRGIDQGQDASAYRSLVSVLELQGTSPRLPKCDKKVTSDCTPNDTAKGGDLRYVGATSTAPLARAQGKADQALLAFGIATWGNWYNVGSNTVPYIDIDVNGDGKPEFETFVSKPSGTDVLVASTVDLNKPLPNGGFQSVDLQPVNGQFGDVDTNVFDSDVIVLPVSLKALGIDPNAASARLSYTVGVSGFYTGPADKDGVIDKLDKPMSFDPLKPGLWAQGGGDAALSYVARPGTALVVNRDAGSLAMDRADKLLVLHHHNASGDRAQVVSVDGARAWSDVDLGRGAGDGRHSS